MSIYGLYAVDNTKDLNQVLVDEDSGEHGFHDNNYDEFKSTKLVFNGATVHTTFGESNNFGIYIEHKVNSNSQLNNKRLVHNGDDIATSTAVGTISYGADVKFGNAVIASDKCINITLSNYNKLRRGEEIPGYLRYNSKYVYNIVNAVTPNTPVVSYRNEYNLDDLTYNSVANEDLLADNEHLVTPATMVDVNIPTLVMRHSSPVIKAGEGVTIEFFVDTKYCDSINEYRIGDTFTIIVTDNNDNEIYRKTVYAGEYIITTAPFKKNNVNVTGAVWYNIRCIDNHGRTSYEFCYDVIIKEHREEELYEMTEEDFEVVSGKKTYTITPDSDKRDFLAGFHNRKAFQILFNKIASEKNPNGTRKYDGIKLYNAKDRDSSLDNSRYYIDYHRPVDDANENSVNPTLPTEYTYYLFKVDFTGNDGQGSIVGLNKDPKDLDIETDFVNYKVTKGKRFAVDSTIVQVNTENTFDWIRTDGARIFRDTNGKVLTMWGGPLLGPNEVYCSPIQGVNRNTQRFLKVKSLKAFVNYVTTKIKVSDGVYRYRSLDEYFTEGPGWYYFYEYNSTNQTIDGKRIRHSVSKYPIVLPDNFILDFNNTGFYSTDWTDSSEKLPLVSMQRGVNIHLRNGTLDGDFSPESLKTAYLKCGFIGGHVGEDRAMLSTGGSTCCSLENMNIQHSLSYCMPMGPSTVDRVKYFIYDMTFTNLGIIDKTGKLNSSCIVLKDAQGNSMLMPNAVERKSPTNATDICIATTKEFVPLYNSASLNPQAIVIGSAYGSAREWCGGKYDIYFIHCFDENKKYLKTIKTHMYKGVKMPMNTVYMKITGYGVCSVNKQGVVTQCIDSYTGDDKALRATTLINSRCVSGLLVKNCHIRDTRSTGVTGPVINGLYEDCTFERIALTPVDFTLTPVLYDLEESLRLIDGIYFNRCTVIDSKKLGYDSTHNHVVTASLADNITLKECVGFGLGFGGFDHLCVKDSKLDNYHPAYVRARGNNFQNIICRTVIADETYHAIDSYRAAGKAEDGNLMATVKFKKYASDNGEEESIERNPCDEPTTLYATYHECVTTPVRLSKNSSGTTLFEVRGRRAVPKKIKGTSSPVPASVNKMYNRIKE